MTSGTATVGFLSTYPPTRCGLATFTSALVQHMGGAAAGVGVVQVVDHEQPVPAPEVVTQLVNGDRASGRTAARALDDFDVVVVQHEYGIFGGPDGRDVLTLVDSLRVPVVVVLHTVLVNPTRSQREILLHLMARAAHLVTMTQTARDRLLEHYDADPDHVSVVQHGAADHRDLGPVVRAGLPAGRRPTVLTWGLLGPGKGIEWAVDAMVDLRDLNPRYLVLGRTHPKVLEHSGDGYRQDLMARVRARGVADLVEFDDSYLDVDSLARVVAAADVVLLPYDSREQVTSGVLIEAVAAGRPVVSTAFPHAVELLGDGTGLLVPRQDPPALAVALRTVLSDTAAAREMAARAEAKAPELVWPAVAARYRQITGAVARHGVVAMVAAS